MHVKFDSCEVGFVLLVLLTNGGFCGRSVMTKDYLSQMNRGVVQAESANKQNCTNPRSPPLMYNSSCTFVEAECSEEYELINYLAFVLCDLHRVQPLGYTVLGIWLLYLISLLATTVDTFFVPPLTMLSEKLKLSHSVAGITLMALGNGAADIFVMYSGVVQDDLELVLGALIGGGMFVTTVVVGTVILVSNAIAKRKVDKVAFMRDIIAYMVVVAMIIAVAFDGRVYLMEVILFPLLYFIYILIVIAVSYGQTWLRNKRQKKVEVVTSTDEPIKSSILSHSLRNAAKLLSNREHLVTKNKVVLPGLTWPGNINIFFKIQWVIHWPVSLLQWITIPPCSPDGKWSKWHYMFAVCSPAPMFLLLLIAIGGWNGFKIHVGKLPLPAMLVIIGIGFSILLMIVLSSKQPLHWGMQLLLAPISFVMAITWLNIIANEIVSALQAIGLLFNVNTAILGLTILAIGNSVADWVADTVIARAGKPEMAFASCYGSPLLSSVLGLSVAFIVKIAIYNHGEVYHFRIDTPEYSQVKLSWIFLGISLLSTAVLTPALKFSFPWPYGILLTVIYIFFIVFVVLGETGVVPVNL